MRTECECVRVMACQCGSLPVHTCAIVPLRICVCLCVCRPIYVREGVPVSV